MKNRMRQLILACTSIGIILGALGSLFFIPSRPYNNASRPVPNISNGGPSFPIVDVTDFRNQGRLAFGWRGSLFTLDGKTGDVKRLIDASKPVWSHDGEWLAFKSATYLTDMTSSSQLWLMRRDGTHAHQVQVSGSFEQFLWSPVANVIAIDCQDGIWLVPADGEPRQLVSDVRHPGQFEGNSSFAWSPDGKTLAYNITLPSNDKVSPSDVLYTVSIDGGKPTRCLVAPEAGIKVAAWWPDGKGILYWLDPDHSASLAADGMGLYSLRLGETRSRILATGLDHQGWLSFSPQGKLLMVIGDGRIAWTNKSLAVINVETGSVQRLKNPEGMVAFDPSFSPDGSRIAFIAAKEYSDASWGSNIHQDIITWTMTRSLWIENADGSDAHPLTSAVGSIFAPLVWSKDGTSIMYQAGALCMAGVDNGKRVAIVSPFPWFQNVSGSYGFVSDQDSIAWFKQ